MSITAVDVRPVDEIGAAIQTLVHARASIAVVLASALFVNERRQIAAFALAPRLPTVFNFREHVDNHGACRKFHPRSVRGNWPRGIRRSGGTQELIFVISSVAQLNPGSSFAAGLCEIFVTPKLRLQITVHS